MAQFWFLLFFLWPGLFRPQTSLGCVKSKTLASVRVPPQMNGFLAWP